MTFSTGIQGGKMEKGNLWFVCPRRGERVRTIDICRVKGPCQNPDEWVYLDLFNQNPKGIRLICHWKSKAEARRERHE
jgi:hypothetical protein